ncbi:MAG: sodium:proton antiporter [Actinomycetales bacterium]|nr:sodium:proton antiporter [Actinomycetales bacterium]
MSPALGSGDRPAPDPDDERDALPGDGRDETENERLDRNWAELLQELRVTQTGSQILTGFLLTIPFQSGFADLGTAERTVYLVLVTLAILGTLLALAPVSLHRTLFRRGAKPDIVRIGDRVVRAVVLVLALTLAGTALLVFDLVAGPVAGGVAAGVTLVGAVAAWFAMPRTVRARRARDEPR